MLSSVEVDVLSSVEVDVLSSVEVGGDALLRVQVEVLSSKTP
jgi:hypothetical protein